jgi:hypothetical protein
VFSIRQQVLNLPDGQLDAALLAIGSGRAQLQSSIAQAGAPPGTPRVRALLRRSITAQGDTVNGLWIYVQLRIAKFITIKSYSSYKSKEEAAIICAACRGEDFEKMKGMICAYCGATMSCRKQEQLKMRYWKKEV